MSSGINMTIILGNLGRDAELRVTESGRSVCNFTMCTNESWKKEDGSIGDHQEWHRVVVWGNQADSVIKYLKKGKQVQVIGRLRTRKWADKDGSDRYTTEIHADRVILLGGGNYDNPPPPNSKFTDGDGPNPDNYDGGASDGPPKNNDDIPF